MNVTMKAVTTTFLVQILYLCCADSSSVTSLISPTSVVSGVKDAASNLTSVIIPACLFGANSVSFLLFTRNNRTGIPISMNDDNPPMVSDAKTVMLVHGFTAEANNSAFNKIFHALLDLENVNVFSLNWQEGACSTALKITDVLGYGAAVNNTVEVGEYMANFTVKLFERGLLLINETRIVGHSLGAHVCGYAGKAIKLKTKTLYNELIGLDPAGPLFRNSSCDKRLCETDAKFVITIQTSNTLGIHKNIGHVNFYFNGGQSQPQCILPTCSHSSAPEYFTYSLHPNCFFIGTPWKLNDNLEDTIKTSQCNKTVCSVAGLLAPLFGGRGSLLVRTKSVEPYCINTTVTMAS